jgi:hypothetical protein
MHNQTSKGVNSRRIDSIKIGCAAVQGYNDLFPVKRGNLMTFELCRKISKSLLSREKIL